MGLRPQLKAPGDGKTHRSRKGAPEPAGLTQVFQYLPAGSSSLNFSLMYTTPHSTAEWTDRLAFDMALMLEGSGEPLDAVLDTHQISRDDILIFNKDPLFQKKVTQFRDEIRTHGVTFRMKARTQAEELLMRSWMLIHDPDVSPTVQADLIKWTAKMANLEPRSDTPSIDAGGGVRITINLNQPEPNHQSNASHASPTGLQEPKFVGGSSTSRP